MLTHSMKSRTSRRRLKDSWKRKFHKPPVVTELVFPTSLSPVSTFEPTSPITNRYQSSPSEGSASPSFSSISSFTSNDTAESVLDSLHKPRPKGPKIKPFIYTQTQQPANRSKLSCLTCFICEESVENKLSEECILELQCGDFVHEQCLNISVDYKLQTLLDSSTFTAQRQRLASLVYPVCKGENCHGSEERVRLADKEYHDSLMARAISKSIEYDKKQLRMSRAWDEEQDKERNQDNREYTKSDPEPLGAKTGASFAITSANVAMTTTSESMAANSETSNRSSHLRPPIDLPFRLTRGDSLLSYSIAPSIRSVSLSPTVSTANLTDLNDTIQVASHKFMSPERLKDDLLQLLLKQCADITLRVLVTLGDLRLADKLLVKDTENGNFSPSLVFLFDNYLVVLDPGSEHWMFHWKDSVFLFESGAVKIANGSKCMWLSSETSSILEKWVIGLSDVSFDFPPAIITSTLDVNEPSKPTIPSRLSDSTINLLDDSQAVINDHFMPLVTAGTLGSESLVSNGDQLIKEILQKLDVSNYELDEAINDTKSSMKLEETYSGQELESEPDCESEYSSDSDSDSDQEMIQQFI